jgi:hypothetical protein
MLGTAFADNDNLGIGTMNDNNSVFVPKYRDRRCADTHLMIHAGALVVHNLAG